MRLCKIRCPRLFRIHNVLWMPVKCQWLWDAKNVHKSECRDPSKHCVPSAVSARVLLYQPSFGMLWVPFSRIWLAQGLFQTSAPASSGRVHWRCMGASHAFSTLPLKTGAVATWTAWFFGGCHWLRGHVSPKSSKCWCHTIGFSWFSKKYRISPLPSFRLTAACTGWHLLKLRRIKRILNGEAWMWHH